MNIITKELSKLTSMVEEAAPKSDCFRQSLHLMPPTGWLNDPNGLCQFQGVYHAFFQYSPFDKDGGLKLWGHYTSKNMIDWEYEGAALYPDQVFDCHGVYSGSALIEDGKMYLYYTGNVKLEDGDYDYINTGRQSNTILVTSEDGKTFSQKKLLLTNEDYPQDLTCHVRDPKVWKDGGVYYMIQGARTKEDRGVALIYSSEDLLSWKYVSRVTTEEPFGYMWECPDYFEIKDKKILSASVQGLSGGIWDDRNVYQSGYFTVEGDLLSDYRLSEYKLWDYGFDYYAPQSFQTEDGRIIHISWMGMPDCEDYTNLTRKDGWQHCFTFPREIVVEDGRILQRPIRELEEKKRELQTAKGALTTQPGTVWEADIKQIQDNDFSVLIGEELGLIYKNGSFEMRFRNQEMSSPSAGRSLRYLELEKVENLKILADASSVEVFVNDGEYVFSTRYYPEKDSLIILAEDAFIELYAIEK